MPTPVYVRFVQGELQPTTVPWAEGDTSKAWNPGPVVGLGSSSMDGGSHAGLLVLI